jgi:hypothetical protein
MNSDLGCWWEYMDPAEINSRDTKGKNIIKSFRISTNLLIILSVVLGYQVLTYRKKNREVRGGVKE